MQSVAIRELKTNPSILTAALERGESVFVTKHGKPLGITLPLQEDLFSLGVKKLYALELYKSGTISMGKMADMLGMDKSEAMRLLSDLKIEWIESDIEALESECTALRPTDR